ncbi:hypothetical protein EDC18_10589 [Natranaerovirga pectinivora]|uniref:Sporulation related protein n=1 Tax=Natranaerovirga pectinivora TaxID=682400 RepID=A0A4R3ML68_9FIRM|nr:hypothetical protein [Natranaerovirga pectinivora]TCT14608.1 hypothetical protein EDC18_10589 [Natranaerovirga pectinivora]
MEVFLLVLMTIDNKTSWVLYGSFESMVEASNKMDYLKAQKIQYYNKYKIITKDEIKNFSEVGWKLNVKY